MILTVWLVVTGLLILYAGIGHCVLDDAAWVIAMGRAFKVAWSIMVITAIVAWWRER